MELTPRLLHDVEFSQEWRGYNREEVDDFLERVAASVEQLLTRLREASERAPQTDHAEAARPADAIGGEEAITRTLVLAQRTADAAIAEAKEAAAGLVAEAEERAAAVIAAAEADARRILDSARAGAAEEAKALEETRSLLQADVEALDQHLAEQRRAVEGVVERLQAMLDDPEAMRSGERPELHVTAPIEPPADDVGEPDVEDAEAFADDGGPPTMEVATVVVDDEPDIDLSAADRSSDAAREDDPFLAELRKAVTDDEPLGPRDDDDLIAAGHALFDQDQLDAREGLRSRLRRRP